MQHEIAIENVLINATKLWQVKLCRNGVKNSELHSQMN